MKAAVYRRYGPPDVVTIEEVPRHEPDAKEVLMKSTRRRSRQPMRGIAAPGCLPASGTIGS